MTEPYHIKNLDIFLQECLGSNKKIINVTTTPFMLTHQTFGSEIYQLEVLIEDAIIEKQEILHLIAKVCPRNEFFKKAYDVGVTFKLEIHFYSNILSSLQEFQKEQGISSLNCCAKYYGGRISLNQSSNAVDDDAVLFLENLRFLGYSNVERSKGFDLDTTVVALKDMANLHATVIALKLLKPDNFEKQIRLNLIPSKMFGGVTEEAEDRIINSTTDAIKSFPDYEYLIPNVANAMKKGLRNLRNPGPPREPFATVTQNDYWIDNIMVKFENDKAVGTKIVDFQNVEYASPARDVIVLLFTSLAHDDFETHINRLFELYYNHFISILKDLKCTTNIFTYEMFQEEINVCATNTHFFSIMIFLRHILGKRKQATGKGFPEVILTDQYKKKLLAVVKYFSKNKWI